MGGRPPQRLQFPPPVDFSERLEALEKACEAAKVPATAQRRAVLSAVLELETHPTADEVLERLARRGMRISRATVFRTLDSLVDLKLISKTCHPGRGMRYDRVTTRHHHLVCLRCNAMVDFIDGALSALPLPDAAAAGFEVTDYCVQVRGLCAECRRSQHDETKNPAKLGAPDARRGRVVRAHPRQRRAR